MAENLFSDQWFRVAHLTPRLKSHARVHRHDYRGDIWYILQDMLSGRTHRFSRPTNFLVSSFDGKRTVDDIWNAACTKLGDDAPTQDEFIRLLSQLYSSDLLVTLRATDHAELERRRRKQALSELKQKLWSPLSLKVPLIDPDGFVTRTMPYVAWIFSGFGLLLWLSVVATGATFAVLNWEPLTNNVGDRILSASNIAISVLVYPLVKAIHEMGHAYAIKRWGGDVHEMGVMLIALMPVPYVDASDATAMRQKSRRMLTSAVGVLAEVFMAAVAMIVWNWAEPGIVRAVAFTVLLICGVSTLLFNGNPLLRFDGYYVLADWLEIPNLASRANKYYGYLIQKYLYRMKNAESPVTARGEAGWFAFYGAAAFFYRMLIMFSIIMFIAGRFFFIGVLLAIWAFVTQAIVPVFKMGKFVVSDPKIGRQRSHALRVTGLFLLFILGGLALVPVPYATIANAVVQPPESAHVRVGVSGEVTEVLVAPSTRVEAGQPILATRDLFLDNEVEVLRTKLAEYQAQLDQILSQEPRRSAIVREYIAETQSDLDDAEDRRRQLTITAPASGTVVYPRGPDLAGQFLQKGQVAAFVLDATELEARVAVPEARAGLVRDRTERVDVWLADMDGTAQPATMDRQVPGGSRRLSSPALGAEGGGAIAVDPSDSEGTLALQQVFELDVRFANPYPEVLLGQRAFVRFDHGAAPVAYQAYRALRQLFLERFSI